ncbi:MAG: hypothetical protein IJ838_03810 [Paludibacteraceae bacterium]|nr:hypothetical protein [Paludibacteraceae bacterium]
MTSTDSYNLDKIEINRLKAGSYEFEFELEDAYFRSVELSEILGGRVQVHAVLRVREPMRDEVNISLKLSVKGDVQLVCDRCLDPVTLAVEAEEESDSEDLLEQNEQTLNLRWLAYELIVVNLPLVHRHPEGGCNPQMAALLRNHLSSIEEEPETINL